MKYYYFYILRSKKNNKLYLGFTSDLKQRLRDHNNTKNKSTAPYAPYELIYFSGFRKKRDAVNCEKYFKTSAGWKRLHKMLESDKI